MLKKLLSIDLSYYLFFILFVFLLLMQYQLWFGEGNIPDNLKVKKLIDAQLLINNQKLKENNVLYARIQAYNHGNAGVIGQARYDLGMIKKGEDYFQIKKS